MIISFIITLLLVFLLSAVDQSKINSILSSKLIRETKAIEDDDLRAKVIEKIQEDHIPSHEVREFVKEIQKAKQHKREEILRPGSKTTDQDKIIMDRIRRLEKSVDEFVSIDTNILGSLSSDEKEQIKARLGSMAGKLDEVMKKLLRKKNNG